MAGRRQQRRAGLNEPPVTAEVERLSHEGRGVARVDGKTVFIEGALPGERVVFRYTHRRGQFDEGSVLEVLRAGPDRVEPACAHAARCGGCSLQHLAGPAQLAHKQAVLLELLAHHAGASPGRVLPPVAGPRFGYRRRARLSVRHVAKKDALLVGFREKASHFVADIDSCATLVPAVGERLPALRALVAGLSCAREVPQIEIAAGERETALLLRHLAPLSDEDIALLREFGASTGLRIYAQAGGPETLRRLDGPETPLTCRVAGIELEFLPGDFVQVNAEVNERIVALALELLETSPGDQVLDLFCGLGNFTLPLATRAARVVGVEGESGLVARARCNARRLGFDNVEFIAANLFEAAGLARIPAGPWSKLLLDPPRSGAAEVIETLDFRGIERVCYVSCNPVTLARDAGALLARHGYRLAAAGVLDMFPHTTHLESVALFERR